MYLQIVARRWSSTQWRCIKSVITNYYKGLFGQPEENDFSLVENYIEDIPQVTEEETNILLALFTKKEIKDDDVFQMEHNKSPGLYSFPAEFYQVILDIIKPDLMTLFLDFYEEFLPLFTLNFGVITLLPEIKEMIKIQ